MIRFAEARPVFTWDNATKHFRNPKGRFISQEQVTALRREYIAGERAINDRLAERLFKHEIDINQWRAEMRANLRRTYITQYMLAKGGKGQMTQRDYGILGSQLKKQYNFLDKFTQDIYNGKYSERQQAMVAARQQLYAESSSQAFERGSAEAFGPLQLPAWPGDGSTQCLSNCRCNWFIKTLKDGTISVSWRLGRVKERHCTDCPTRAKVWRNLKFAPSGEPLKEIEVA
jgi:hypothetical protein